MQTARPSLVIRPMLLSLAYSLGHSSAELCLVRRRSDAQLRTEVLALGHRLRALQRPIACGLQVFAGVMRPTADSGCVGALLAHSASVVSTSSVSCGRTETA